MNLQVQAPLEAGDPGTGQTVSRWTSLHFQQPFGVGVTLQAKQSKLTVFTPSGGLPESSAPYLAEHMDLSYEEILALPSADAFFGEVFGALDAKVSAKTSTIDNTLPPALVG